jgi:hypothetical protein
MSALASSRQPRTSRLGRRQLAVFPGADFRHNVLGLTRYEELKRSSPV